MTRDIDDALAALAASPLDRSLDRLPAEISRDIAGRREQAQALRALAPVRLAAVGLALAIGVSSGGAVALAAVGAPRPADPFAAGTQLAPSALLEGVE